MVNAISGLNSYYSIYPYSRAANLTAASASRTQNVKNSAALLIPHRAADPETPVQPVRPVLPVNPDEAAPVITAAPSQAEKYAAEQAVRFRIQYADSGNADTSKKAAADTAFQPLASSEISAELGFDPAEMAVRMRIQYAKPSEQAENGSRIAGTGDVKKTEDNTRCETCEKRKYQDGSDDPSVSFQTPTRINPDAAASAVRGHEMEHVFHEQAKAEREDRKVVSQSVTLHTGICPECGRVYVSGGTTRTVTKADNEPDILNPDTAKNNKSE